jgi:DNA-binding transcriptional ArsR family regulator
MVWKCGKLSIESCDIATDQIKQLKEFFSLLADCNRIKIICLLLKNWKMCVCELEKTLGIKQNLVSHHLSLLRKFGLVEYEKEWRSVYYSINLSKYDALKNNIRFLIPNIK